MARYHFKTRGSLGGPDLTPFIDIVFNLLIFFMLAWKMGATASGEKIELPEAKDPVSKEIREEKTLIITLTPGGEAFVDGRRLAAEDVPAFLASERSRRGEELTVLVRADRLTEFQRVSQIMRQGAAAGIAKMSFGVLEGQEY